MTATRIDTSRLALLALIAFALLGSTQLEAAEPAFSKKTYTFKTVGDVKIQADVYRAEDDTVRPVVVYIHGGALITGSRTGVPKRLLGLCRKEGFALVSLDYRLAPEVKLPAIIEDIQDAFRWLHEQGPKMLHIDADRIVVSGGSAGGYLTLMTGFCVQPRPVALASYWGYGDVDGDWLSKPSEHYRKAIPLISKEEAHKGVGKKVLSGEDDGSNAQRGRNKFFLYCRQNGLWTKEVTGFDPEKDRKKLDQYCPIRNVSTVYPPSILLQGNDDTDVTYDRSVNMDKELTRHKVLHELVTVKGAPEHGLANGDKKVVAEANEKVEAFICHYLKTVKKP